LLKAPTASKSLWVEQAKVSPEPSLRPAKGYLFEPNSYGFRPGRSCHDAIKQIKLCIQNKAKYALDADITRCFDRINHEALLQKLNNNGKVRQQIKAWLKSGLMTMQKLKAIKAPTMATQFIGA